MLGSSNEIFYMPIRAKGEAMVQKLLNIRSDAAYGLTGPVLDKLAPTPVVAQRNPTIRDKGKPGTVWINQVLGTIFVVVKTAANQTTWASYSTQTGAFHSVTIDTGDLQVVQGDVLVDAGNLTLTAGTVSAGGAVTAGTQMTAQTTITCGETLSCGGVIVADDPGVGSTSNVTISNALAVSGSGAGFLRIASGTDANGLADGFIKVYIGTDTAYIPYFKNLNPT